MFEKSIIPDINDKSITIYHKNSIVWRKCASDGPALWANVAKNIDWIKAVIEEKEENTTQRIIQNSTIKTGQNN